MIAEPLSHRLIGLLGDDRNIMRSTLDGNRAEGN
jgi:hypothetical protein